MSRRHADIRVRRVYDEPEQADGTRVLVDRLWPRGLAKQDAAFDHWRKAVAPSSDLRKWYGHDPSRFDEFSARYLVELAAPERSSVVDELRALARRGPLTLLTASRESDTSNAAVLADLLRGT